MLMTVLKGEKAIKQSKALIRLFKSMKNYILDNNLTENYINYVQNLNLIESKLLEHDNNIKLLKESFTVLEDKYNVEKINREYILYNGEFFESYVLMKDILNSAKEEIIIIDNYINSEILKMLSKIDKKIIVISKNIDDKLIEKYRKEYSNIEFKYNDIFHDRFILIDKEILYSIGASLKDFGKKCFAINKIENKNLIDELLKEV